MATPEELKTVYDPPFGALYPDKTAAYLVDIPSTDAFGGDEALVTDQKLIELRLGQVASSIRNIETGLHAVAYEASVLKIFADKNPKVLEQLPAEMRQAIKTVVGWLASVEGKHKTI